MDIDPAGYFRCECLMEGEDVGENLSGVVELGEGIDDGDG